MKRYKEWMRRRCEKYGHRFFVELSFGPTWCNRCGEPNELARMFAARLGRDPYAR